MNEKKVLIYALTGSTSGITQYILNYVDQFDLEKYQFDFVSYQNDKLKKWADEHEARYYNMNVSLYKQPLQYKRYLEQIFSSGYDVVHFHLSSVSDLRQFRYAKVMGIPRIIVHSHSSFLDCSNRHKRQLFTKIHLHKRKFISRYADCYCACSAMAAEWMFGSEIDPKRISILHNGIDVNRFAYRSDVRVKVRTLLGISDEILVVGHVGRFTYQKNHEFLLRVFAQIVLQHPNACLLLLGEGENENDIKKLAHQLFLDGKVYFVGSHEDISDFYQAMDLFVLPSRFEGLPIVGIEAQASGLPCLFSSEITQEAAVLENSCRFLPLNSSYASWAEAALNINRPDRSPCAALVRKQGFSIENQIKELKALYS